MFRSLFDNVATFHQFVFVDHQRRGFIKCLFCKGFEYKIDLAGATDISDPANSATGKLFGGKTAEELKDAATIAANGITPVKKTLAADLMTDISSLYPHDKAEGIVVINSSLIAVCNDDDFGITTGAGAKYIAKDLPSSNSVDKNRIYFIKLKSPL